ncbi:MAG: nitroreductase family protein [Propionibacteriaceae bacterium]
MPASPGPRPADRAGSLLALIAERHSVRRFTPDPICRESVDVLVDAVAPASGRALPSAHALDPLRFILIAHRVDDLEPGAYGIRAGAVEPVGPAPTAGALLDCCLDRPAWTDAAAVIAITADPDPIEHFRGQDGDERRGERFTHLEAGHAAQNVQLTATALGLGTVFIGGIIDQRLAGVLSLAPGVRPLGLLPLGTPAPA